MIEKSGLSEEISRVDRIVDRHERRQLVPYSDVQVWRLEKKGAFPKRIRLGPGRVGWSMNEIQAWIAERLDDR